MDKIIKIIFKTISVVILSPGLLLFLIIDLGRYGLDYREWMIYDFLN